MKKTKHSNLLINRYSKCSQIWVETVIYTLIGLAIIGILLAIIKPAIDEKKDQIIIEQSLDMLNNIENQIEDVRYYGVGNSRPIEIKIKKGQLKINGEKDYLEFSIESKYTYSEPGENISIGKIIARTEKTGKKNDVSLTLDYSNKLNLTWNGKDEEKILNPSPSIYTITVTNIGKSKVDGELINVDFS